MLSKTKLTKIKTGKKYFSAFVSKRDYYNTKISGYGESLFPYKSKKNLTRKNILRKKTEKFHNLKPEDMPFYASKPLHFNPIRTNIENLKKVENSNPGCVEVIQMDSIDREVLLLGTNHDFEFSYFLTLHYMKMFKPESIVVELCDKRILESYQTYEELSERKIEKIIKKNNFFSSEGFEFVLPFIYNDYISDERVQIIPGDLDINYFDSLMESADEKCTCTEKTSYIKFRLEMARLNNKLRFGWKIQDDDFEKMKYLQVNRNCVKNLISMKRELSLLNSIVNYSSGSAVMAIVGINHLDRLKFMLEQFDQFGHDVGDIGEVEDRLKGVMKEFGECK